MLCREGKLSLYCFSSTIFAALLPEIVLRLGSGNYGEYYPNFWFPHILTYALCNLILLCFFRGYGYQIALRSTLLGYAVGLGMVISYAAPPSWQMFGVYMALLALFHYGEFLSIAWANPSTLSIDSFIINHSVAYAVAASLSWVEYAVERYFYPEMKIASLCSYFGIMLTIFGDVLRKTAICTAKNNFNHVMQSEKKKDHVLITHGIYGICRHPSYVGWFYWAIGTQLILHNPLSTLAYIISVWRFFHDRIFVEELMLRKFFGDAYVEYQNKVPTGLPFISGVKSDL